MQPTIYLGLGGTGIQTLSYLKKQCVDAYGEEHVPKEIAFLGVDTMRFPYIDDLDIIGCQIPLVEYYKAQKQKGYLKWLHDENLCGIPTTISFPNASLRTTGRLAADASISHIIYEFEKRMNTVSGSNDIHVSVHVITSLAGGFGSGSLIPIVAALRNKFGERINVYGHGVLHNIFIENNPPSSQLVLPNGIASVLELDHLFSTDFSTPINLEVAGEVLKIDETLFDNFFLFDNKDDNGNVVTQIDNLCEILATTLYPFHLKNPLSLSVFDILQLRKNTGEWDVANKKAWAQSLSSCSVVYKSDVLAEQYQIRAAIKIIDNMLRKDAHIREDVLKWIESNNFRETYDLIINAICSPEHIANLELPKLNPTKSDEENINTCVAYAYPHKHLLTTETTQKLLSSYGNSLHNVVDNYFIFKGEIGNAIVFLHELQNYCDIFKNKLEGDFDHIKRIIKIKDQSDWLQKSYASYLEQKAEWWVFRRGRKNQELLDTLVGIPAKERIKLNYEIERRQLAYSLISEFVKTIEFYLKDLELYADRLTNVQRRLLIEKETLNIQRNSICEIDLSLKELQNMEIDNNDTSVNAFILIGLPHQSIFDMSEDDIRYTLLNRTANSPRVQKYRTTSISDAVNRLSDIEFAKLQAHIQTKLRGWLKIYDRGLLTNTSQQISKSIVSFITYSGPTDLYSRFAKNIGEQVIQDETQSAYNHLIFKRFSGWIIPYCIESFDDYTLNNFKEQIQHLKSQKISYNPFIDKQWFERMQDEEFCLIPKPIMP